MSSKPNAASALLDGPASDRRAIAACNHDNPHGYLGPQSATLEGVEGHVVRAFHPQAEKCELLQENGAKEPMKALGGGLFAAWRPGRQKLDYQLVFHFGHESWQRHDPYRFPSSVGDVDLHLLGEGRHYRLWERLGARPLSSLGVDGFAFSVWAPNAKRVSLVGDFCHWDGRLFPMRRLGNSGVFEIFMPSLGSGEVYKFEVVSQSGTIELKSDPLARWSESPPATASRTFASRYRWGDEQWWQQRGSSDIRRSPLAAYEVHVGSWLAGSDALEARSGEPVDTVSETGFRRLERTLIPHVRRLGFNFVELMPVAEHPFDGSWGYQITGYYAPTGRFGNPDDLRAFVDRCHAEGIGVILDWVPAHFVKDTHGLGRFDGTALYEHADPRQGEHPDWGTYIFNYSRNEVRNFLVANCLYWFEEFHIDGLRVDAVASMLYLDYSREDGEWIPNHLGGNENFAALDFLRELTTTVRERCPDRFLIAEESTAWTGVTRAVEDGGLGFTFKWNMGWMHDTLAYFSTDPLFRGGVHDRLTFAMVYEHSEAFLNPLSHDEVVHGKGSLYAKMPGDPNLKLANLRCLLTYQFTRPGKKLLFMGSELAPETEWSPKRGLDWGVLDGPERRGMMAFVEALAQLYRDSECFWAYDPDPDSFEWLSCEDPSRSIISYRRAVPGGLDSPQNMVVILNLTPVPRDQYRIDSLFEDYHLQLNSDEARFGGSGRPVTIDREMSSTERGGSPVGTLRLDLPPLAAIVLGRVDPHEVQASDER